MPSSACLRSCRNMSSACTITQNRIKTLLRASHLGHWMVAEQHERTHSLERCRRSQHVPLQCLLCCCLDALCRSATWCAWTIRTSRVWAMDAQCRCRMGKLARNLARAGSASSRSVLCACLCSVTRVVILHHRYRASTYRHAAGSTRPPSSAPHTCAVSVADCSQRGTFSGVATSSLTTMAMS